MSTTLELLAPERLDEFMRLVLIREQSEPVRSLFGRLATTYVLHGPDAAAMEAAYQDGDGADTYGRDALARVAAYMEAIRTDRFRWWQVGFTHNGTDHPGRPILAPSRVRAQVGWCFGQGATGVTVTEYTETLTSVPVDPDALPTPDRRPVPSVPGARQVNRFYRFAGEGPEAMADAVAVARVRRELRVSRPRHFNLPPVLLDVTRVVMARTVGPDEVAPLPQG